MSVSCMYAVAIKETFNHSVYIVIADRLTGVVKENGWDRLGLKYSADWPLHVLFTTSVLDRF